MNLMCLVVFIQKTNKNKILNGEIVNEFELVEVKTIDLVYPKCPTCGFNNTQNEMFRTCPVCETNLVYTTVDATEPFCFTITCE